MSGALECSMDAGYSCFSMTDSNPVSCSSPGNDEEDAEDAEEALPYCSQCERGDRNER
jgi:hypothetical protein